MAADETELPDDSLEARALRDAGPVDDLARAVARSKVMAALFGEGPPVTLGRFRLLEQVGAGGMGVVWGAWDPELERRVAIKVIKPELASARERIVREGQALAKLSHPHVVPVFDVGVLDDRVYLVMEWVRGETIRAWAARSQPPRAVRDIVRVYREAAMGLAAAHEAGLVHRDFKPENAIVGEDDRVRVLDFGLAREGGAAAGVAGTPRYMAPEQVNDGELTPAVDQFSLGVALREALTAHTKELPRWLAAICTRATAAVPADRFLSMKQLVAALAFDPARVLRRRIAVASALGLASATFVIGMQATETSEERCTGAAKQIEGSWSAADRARVAAHLQTLGPYGAQVAERAGGELATYVKRWGDAHVGACKAHDGGELTDALYTANLACLARSRVALETARDVLGATTLAQLPNALVAVQLLPAAERCGIESASRIPPPAAIAAQVDKVEADVARAFVLARAVDPRAIEASAAAARAATELGHAHLIGRASLVHGLALLLQQQNELAASALANATESALAANDDATAIEAIARRIYAINTRNGPASADAVLPSLELAKSIAQGLTGRDAFARALYYNNLGTLQLAKEDRSAARGWFDEADRVRPPRSRDTFELASIAGNLGLVETDRVKRDALLAGEGDELEAALGADHPTTIAARMKAAMFVENPDRTAALLRDACGRIRRLHAHLTDRIGHCAYELAWLAEERGDLADATDAIAAVAASKSSESKLAVGYRALLAGNNTEVVTRMSATAAELSTGKVWARWRAVDAHLLVAIATAKLGDRALASSHVERALSALDALGDFAKATFVQRRRGRLLAMLVELGARDVEARREAALAWARLAGYDQRVAALTAPASPD